jgi:tetratricopeptide (TPR) repeat protein
MTKPNPALVCGLLLALLGAPRARGQAKGAVSDPESTFNLGLSHLREGRVDMAVESFKKAIKQDPKNAYFYKGLGIAYSQLAEKCPPSDSRCRGARLGEAVAAARKALELNPYYVDARNDLGTALVLSGRRDEGKKELQAAYEDPTNPTPELSARNLGQAFLEEKNYPQAETWFLICVQRNKAYGDAWVMLAEAMIAQNKLADAIEKLEQGEKNAPDDFGLALATGQAYYRAGRFSEARSRWEKVASKDPSGPTGRRALELLRTLKQQ